MSDTDKPANPIADCAGALLRIAEALEGIDRTLNRCACVLDERYGETRWAIRTVTLTD
jgi:hypothetical protein